MEFELDDTRLSYWQKNKIGRIEIFFCCFLTLLIFCPVGWSQQNWPSQQGRKLAKSGSNNFFFQFCQSYSYVNRKVWYHQIWIPSNLAFIVSDLHCCVNCFKFYGAHPNVRTPHSLHFLCSKFSTFLTTYPTLNANVICEGSLTDTEPTF